MSEAPQPCTISFGKKTAPAQFLQEGWLAQEEASLSQSSGNRATLSLTLPESSASTYYLVAELTPLASASPLPPDHAITVWANNCHIGTWHLTSPIMHEKLAVIPGDKVTEDGQLTLTFEAQPEQGAVPLSMELHSICLTTNLTAFLAELQTGYDWVCGIRNKLIVTAATVDSYISQTGHQEPVLRKKLSEILNNPYVKSQSAAQIRFDQNYFDSHFDSLKEGRIHYEIRKWLAQLNELQDSLVDAGNYALSKTSLTQPVAAAQEKVCTASQENDKTRALLREKNELLNNLEILLRKETLTSTPPNLYLDISNICNFRCKMCYQSKLHFLHSRLNDTQLSEISRMMPQLANITVAGLGEPLLSPNLALLSKAADSNHCQIQVITNGSLIHNHIETLKSFSKVSISFDGATAATFETLRHRGNLRKTLKNVAILRGAAPDLPLAFSVVLSRVNLDELAMIVKQAGELGVNEIHLTPIEHMPIMELRSTDKELFDQQMAKANSYAEQFNIQIISSVTDDAFARQESEPRDKPALLNYVQALQVKKNRPRNITQITEKIIELPFHYFPAPVVAESGHWPPRPAEPLPMAQQAEPSKVPASARKGRLQEIQQEIDHLLDEVGRKPPGFFKKPFCLDPWKLTYIISNGQNRLCCHADIVVGNFGRQGYENSTNSTEATEIRKTMFNHSELRPECKKCTAADRDMGLESLRKTCLSLGIELK